MAYCRVMEVMGGACASTCIFINAHHSIGTRALLLFGNDDQKRKWLVPMARGHKLGAFALTEREAGSDAANVQTRVRPSADGTHFILNGQKRYITNGAIAQVLTVMARTPVAGKDETGVTAFLVTPDMPVPRKNVLGPLGKGLKVALTVLDFGRTTFGACCTGAAKKCLQLSIQHANTRRQFDRHLGEFELFKKKMAYMAGYAYAMEAMTYTTAALIDRGDQDYMLETAMLKVYTTDALWMIVNDTFQIYGGAAYCTDQPLERMLRDTRINQIGEGANDVLRYGMERAEAAILTPQAPVRSVRLQKPAQEMGSLIKLFDQALRRHLIKHGQAIFDRQYVHERIAEVAMELFASACVLSRWDSELVRDESAPGSCGQHEAAAFFLKGSVRRTRYHLAELKDNDDHAMTAAADAALARPQIST